MASALVCCATGTSMCRIMNPTSKPVTWPAAYAFAYLNPFEVNAVGAKLIDITNCITTNQNHTTPDEEYQRACGVCDDENRGSRSAEVVYSSG